MAIIVVVGSLMLTVGRSTAQDKKPDPAKESLSTTPVVEKPARLTLRTEAPNEIALKRVTLKGPLVVLGKSDKPLQAFNPFIPGKNGMEPEDFKTYPHLGRPRGFVLFSIGF